MPTHTLTAGTIHEGDWMQADLQPGYTLAIVDGPYAIGKAAWDRMSIDELADWYRPHLARVSALLAPSASVYLWNTAEGWARLHPVMVALGWTLHARITWNKTNAPGIKGVAGYHGWPDVTEDCGFYVRHTAPRRARELRGTRTFSEVGRAVGCDSRLPALWEGWPDVHGSCLPTLAQWVRLGGDPLEYSSLTAPFTMVAGVTNVWTEPLVGGSERVLGPSGLTLHPCQKPLAFAERMILASTRPGERVLVPFGGTCREAVICEWLARTRPEEARGYDVCELNADGVDYIGPVLEQIAGRPTTSIGAAQVRLFGAAK